LISRSRSSIVCAASSIVCAAITVAGPPDEDTAVTAVETERANATRDGSADSCGYLDKSEFAPFRMAVIAAMLTTTARTVLEMCMTIESLFIESLF